MPTDKGVCMKKEVGVWIDHKKAVIVTGNGETLKKLESNMENFVRPGNGGSKGKTPAGTMVFDAEDQRERHFIEHLNKFYATVIAHVHDAGAILIFGPGEAKFELEKKLKNNELHKHVIGIESSDKMTDRQIAAKVKNFFASLKQANGKAHRSMSA
jgi:hypothetical protein